MPRYCSTINYRFVVSEFTWKCDDRRGKTCTELFVFPWAPNHREIMVRFGKSRRSASCAAEWRRSIEQRRSKEQQLPYKADRHRVEFTRCRGIRWFRARLASGNVGYRNWDIYRIDHARGSIKREFGSVGKRECDKWVWRKCDSTAVTTTKAIAAEDVNGAEDPAGRGAGNNSGLHQVTVTSMHICARIFAWAWDLLVGNTTYPMQQVSLLSAFNFIHAETTA